jgi:hypothetical protein
MSNEFFVLMRTRAESQEEYLPIPKTLTGKREVESGMKRSLKEEEDVQIHIPEMIKEL